MPKKKIKKEKPLLEQKIKITAPDGTVKRKSVYGHDVLELADNIRQAQAQAERALCKTFVAVADEWDTWHEPDIKYYTHDCYVAPLKDVKKRFDGYNIDEVKPLDIQRYLQELERLKYAKQTIKLRLTVLRQVYDYAVIHQYVAVNPCTAVKVPKGAGKTKRQLPLPEQIEAVKRAQSEEFGLYALLLLYTGCRRGEALALTYSDVNRRKGTINIDKSVIFENGKPVIRQSTKSAAGVRTVPLPPPLRKALPVRRNGLIFNVNGQPLTLSEFNVAWRNYRRDNGITITPHQLRHAYATICYDAGLDPKEAMRYLGHSKEDVTRDIYTHITNEREKSASSKLNAYIKKTS